MNTKSYILGLPESGKTTFLGALAFTIENAESGTMMYEIDEIGDFRYLYDLANVWSSCEKMARTNFGQYENITLFLKDQQYNKIQLVLPDQSGEEFKRVIENRMMTEVMQKDILESDNIFVFVNPHNMSQDVMLDDIPDELRQKFGNVRNDLENIIMHEQVQYVMLLQDIGRIRKKRTKLKIVISAWDAYNTDKKPQELLKIKMPLLWQYLMTNKHLFECEYWGISAQGGNLDVQDEKDRLLDYENPIERITVVGQRKLENIHDLTTLLK